MYKKHFVQAGRTKFNKHNNVFLRSLKHYTVNMFVEKLQKVNFSNYERFSCIDAAYTDFLIKLIKVVNEIAPTKEIRIDEENYKKVKYQVQNLIRKKKREFYETNLRQTIKKPKGTLENLKVYGPTI